MLVMAAGAFMNFVLGFVVLVLLISARNEPITSRVIYKINEGALCGQTGLEAEVLYGLPRIWESVDMMDSEYGISH